MNNFYICWFSRIILLGILIFKGLTARRIYTLFGVKGLNKVKCKANQCRRNAKSSNVSSDHSPFHDPVGTRTVTVPPGYQAALFPNVV
jgi:hypothetical protein